MKKQFAIKAAQTSKNAILSVAKNESANLLKFLANEKVCCEWSAFQGLTPKTTFSL